MELINQTLIMAYVNVGEWTSQHVGDWLYGKCDWKNIKSNLTLDL